MSGRAPGTFWWRIDSELRVFGIRSLRAAGQHVIDLSLVDPAELSWQDEGLCAEVGPVFFYPEQGENAIPAKRVCEACRVRARCLQWALDNDEIYGVWGGTSEDERQEIRVARDRERNGLAA